MIFYFRPYPVWYKLRQSEAIVVQQHRACQISQRASDRSLENPQVLSVRLLINETEAQWSINCHWATYFTVNL